MEWGILQGEQLQHNRPKRHKPDGVLMQIWSQKDPRKWSQWSGCAWWQCCQLLETLRTNVGNWTKRSKYFSLFCRSECEPFQLPLFLWKTIVILQRKIARFSRQNGEITFVTINSNYSEHVFDFFLVQTCIIHQPLPPPPLLFFQRHKVNSTSVSAASLVCIHSSSAGIRNNNKALNILAVEYCRQRHQRDHVASWRSFRDEGINPWTWVFVVSWRSTFLNNFRIKLFQTS